MIINKNGFDDVNVLRKPILIEIFSKMRSTKNYELSKTTAIALTIVLEQKSKIYVMPMHHAVQGHTAAELIMNRADSLVLKYL